MSGGTSKSETLREAREGSFKGFSVQSKGMVKASHRLLRNIKFSDDFRVARESTVLGYKALGLAAVL